MAKVKRPIVGSKKGKLRKGRGFSRSELEKAGLSLKEAKRMKIPVDKRRKSCREENVDLLKEFLKGG